MSKEKRRKRWVACDVEGLYFGDERKLSKQEKKMASAKDRSKYKKSDEKKYLKSLEEEKKRKIQPDQLLHGRVLSIKAEGVLVDRQGKQYTCLLRGLMKKEKSLKKNLVAVGDFVLFEETSPGEGVIADVEPRKTVLSRADNLNRRKEQLIAANIDQVIITASVVSPRLKFPLIDRYIIAAEKGGMEPIVLINKIDLLDGNTGEAETEKILLEELEKAYKAAGIPIILVSVQTNQGLDKLLSIMQGKASVFSGQSGVGKSFLINAVTGINLPIGSVVQKTRKGSHTTSTAHLEPLKGGGWCIDTPGIKSFGLWNLDKDEIQQYFTEIFEKGQECHFPNCSHTHEEGCAVLDAVEKGNISALRYESYAALLKSVTQKHLRR